MKTFSKVFESVFNILLMGVLVVLWIVFLPVQFGGATSFVVVNGVSMESTLHPGELVVTRHADGYQVGDIVTYRDNSLNRFVIHRIVGIEQGHFILKGDNNQAIDLYRPTQSEILGKLWIYVPFNLSKIFSWFRNPLNGIGSAILTGGIFMAFSMLQPSSKKVSPIGETRIGEIPSGETPIGETRRGESPQSQSPEKTSKTLLDNITVELQAGLYILCFIAFMFFILSVIAFSNSITKPSANLEYQQTGAFFYSAAGKPGIYDSDKVHSGEPIFPALTCSLNVGFVYNLVGGNGLQNTNGSQLMAAQITDDQSGWQRTISLVPATAFTGNSYSTSSVLDLCQIEALVASVETETNFRPVTYTLTVLSHASVSGAMAGQSVNDSFEPKLVFKFDKVHFFLANQKITALDNDPMLTVKKASLVNPLMVENSLSLLGYEFSVFNLRYIGVLGLMFCLIGFGVLGWYIYHLAHRSQESLITIKYGHRIMNVYNRGFENMTPVVDVSSIDDLAKLSELQNTVILHMNRDNLHYYLIQTGRTTYRYVVSEGKRSSIKAALVQSTQGE